MTSEETEVKKDETNENASSEAASSETTSTNETVETASAETPQTASNEENSSAGETSAEENTAEAQATGAFSDQGENESAGAESTASADEDEEVTDEKPKRTVDGSSWYVVHTYSGYENKAKLALEERIKSLKQTDFFEEVIVPEENVIEVVKGKKKTTKRRFFPGYILVKMILTDETWHVVKNTPKITGFVGDKLKPLPVPESEVQKMTSRIAEGEVKPRHRISFQEGESVKVTDGPFSNFSGVIEEVNLDKAKVKVTVSIFGRSTPVELDFTQVEKI